MIELLSHEELLAWVKDASDDPCPHVLIVSVPKRHVRSGFLYASERAARAQAMTFQCFDPDLFKYELIRPAAPDEITRGTSHNNMLFEEPYEVDVMAAPKLPAQVLLVPEKKMVDSKSLAVGDKFLFENITWTVTAVKDGGIECQRDPTFFSSVQ